MEYSAVRGAVRRLLALLALAVWAPALRGQGDMPVRLVAPETDVALVGGSAAELEWAPLATFVQLPKVEEWEAFLSLDGGRTYPLRITPHLDRDLRRIRWQVPPLPTPDARLLLRFGDEHEETGFEMPQRFTIAAPPVGLPAAWTRLTVFTRQAPSPGEAALPGQAGVVAWVEGSRRGGSLRQVVAAPSRGARPRSEIAPGRFEPLEAVTDRLPGSPPARTGREGTPTPPWRRPGARAGTAPLLPCVILLLTQRQNE